MISLKEALEKKRDATDEHIQWVLGFNRALGLVEPTLIALDKIKSLKDWRCDPAVKIAEEAIAEILERCK